MYYIPYLAIAFAVLTPNAKANEMTGNLAFCISDNSENGIGEEKCLDPAGGVLRSLPPTNAGGIQETATPVLNWRYDNGLIRASLDGQSSIEKENLCLGPVANELGTNASKPYELVLKDCPSDITANRFDSTVETETRQMRFVITEEGRVQSLAAVLDPATGEDTTTTHPYCLTASVDEKVHLAPCSETVNGDFHQVFDVYGTYSGFFVMPLRATWEYDGTVEIAYQLGAGYFRNVEAPYVEISQPRPIDGLSLPSVREWLVAKFPLEQSASGGIISFAPSDYRVEGPMAASIKRFDDDLILSRATFFVSKSTGPAIKGPNSSYLIFTILLLAFVGCFLLSTGVEYLCQKKTRADGDGNNDGKTVCMSTEEEEDFPLEDISVIEEASTGNDTEAGTETDLDESRNSSTVEGSDIVASERDEEVPPKIDGDDDDDEDRTEGNNKTNKDSNV